MRRNAIVTGVGALALLVAAASSQQGSSDRARVGGNQGGQSKAATVGTYPMESQPVGLAARIPDAVEEDRFLLLATFPDENMVRVFDEGLELLSEEPSVLMPLGIAVAGNLVYVGSGKKGRVDVFRLKGKRLDGPLGSLGAGDGEFERPVAIAVSPLDGRLHVADVEGKELRTYDPDTLQPVGSIGVGVITSPCGVAFNSQGTLFVSDMMEGVVLKFGADGTYLGKFTSRGKYPGQTVRPIGLAVDDLDQVYVVDAFYGRVQMYDAAGAWVGDIGAIGRGPGLTETPLHAAFHPVLKRLYVSDSTDEEVETYDLATGQ